MRPRRGRILVGQPTPIITAKRPFNRHVRERLSERHVPEGAVDYVLNNWTEKRPAGRSTIYSAPVDGQDLKVYVRNGTNPPVVTTVAWKGEQR